MRHYETIYIADPNLSDEDYQGVLEKFSTVVETHKGVMIKTQEWGKQRMAYTVKKFDKGFYVLIEFCAGAGVTAELERSLKLDDKIVKYQTVKLADKVDPQELLQKEQDAQEVKTADDSTEQGDDTESEGDENAEA